MRENDKQLGSPEVLFKATQSGVESLTGLEEGAKAFATDINAEGIYQGTKWIWSNHPEDLTGIDIISETGVSTSEHRIYWITTSGDPTASIYAYADTGSDNLNFLVQGGGTQDGIITLLTGFPPADTYSRIVLTNPDVGDSFINIEAKKVNFPEGDIYVNGDTTGMDARVDALELKKHWTYLDSPLTSTSWDGDARSSTGKTVIDLSSVFSVPANVKAVLVRLYGRDSGSASSTAVYFGLSPNNTGASIALAIRPTGILADAPVENTGVCPCNLDGDIYFQCAASGTGTLDIWIEIWGYCI